MALKPLFLDLPETYGADELGLPYRDLVGEGVVGASDLEVTADGTDMTVDVATGACWIKGDNDANLQPTYRWYHDEAESLVIAAADVTNPRKDLVIAEVIDTSFGGGSDTARVRVITGTPAGAPAEPALPDNAIKLAVVDVPASDTQIAQAQITDSRPRAVVGGGAASGGELAYGDRTAPLNVTATTEGTAQEVAATPETYFDGSPVIVTVFSPFVAVAAAAAGGIVLVLYEDGVAIGRFGTWNLDSAGRNTPAALPIRHTPDEGLHTYSWRAFGADSAGAVVGAGVGGVADYFAAYIRITRA